LLSSCMGPASAKNIIEIPVKNERICSRLGFVYSD
jgi:hypothetical protein